MDRATVVAMRMLGMLAGCCLAAACAAPDEPQVGSLDSEVRVCADGPVVEGIDVSKWQAGIDWDSVADDGIRFAVIRVNHGLNDIDERFAYNWSEARRVGIIRGAYQYFLPDEDPVEQAELLLSLMGPLEADDLPPVIDVEEAAGQSPETIRAAIHAWSDTVEAAIGRKPLIYTAKYFWQDGVGAPADFLDHPLWVANYNVECPLIADPWERWNMWQYTSTGRVAGISGNVDRDHFNGTYEDLVDFALGEPPVDPPMDPMDPMDPVDPNDPNDPGDPGDPNDPVASGCSAGNGGSGLSWCFLALALLVVPVRRRRRR